MLKIFLLLIFSTSKAMPFFLISNGETKFPVLEVKINVSENSCNVVGLSPESLLDLMEEAMQEHWNNVSTSGLELIRGEVLSGVDISADADFSSTVARADPNTILVGCNSGNTDSFSNNSTLAIGGISKDSGGNVRGAVQVDDMSGSGFPALSHTAKLATLAHEIGHAIGIGHSKDEIALMYYSVSGKVQENLSEDDWDAVTYLYPADKELGGLAGACGSIDTGSNSSDGGRSFSMILGLILSVFIFKNRRKNKIENFC